MRTQAPPPRRIHLLIPSHVGSESRLQTFKRCASSVVNQTYSNYEVFLSISGLEKYRKKSINFVTSQKTKPWNIHDTGKQQLSQMEHLRKLLQISYERDPQAFLMFLDNDDMMHPMRLMAFNDASSSLDLPDNMPFTIPCKLIISSETTTTAPNATMDSFISSPRDFDQWKRNSKLRRKNVQLIPSSRCDDMDCNEYFDYIVPTSVMVKFFNENPVGITSHKFCDLILYRVLADLFPYEAQDHPSYPWLLIHYKVSEDAKKHTFDNHGRRDKKKKGKCHSIDQASFGGEFKPSDRDVNLARKYHRISPGQVAMCRGHLESLVITYIGRDNWTLNDVKRQKTIELNGLYGYGLGNELWAQAHEDMFKLTGGKHDQLQHLHLPTQSQLFTAMLLLTLWYFRVRVRESKLFAAMLLLTLWFFFSSSESKEL